MNGSTSAHHCIYCGGKARRPKKGKGEHVIPKALGGALTIRSVCGACNNSFSNIDAELCSRSPLSIIASQEIDAHIRQVWDVDRAAGNLLLEARPDWMANSGTLYPQVIFDQKGPQIRGDWEEMIHFGDEACWHVLVKSMLRAFRHYEAGQERWLHLERLDLRQELAKGYRFPPRIFSRHSIPELAHLWASRKMSPFVLRYLTKADRRFAMNVLDNWDTASGFRSIERGVGSPLPVVACSWDPGMVLRALAKTALNLLASQCPNTPVNRDWFARVMNVVVGTAPVTPKLLRRNGFVHAADIEPIKAEGSAHSFRLMHVNGQWSVWMSFFGGRIGAFVRFPGPNGERWRRADIVAPLHSKDWEVETGSVVVPLCHHVEWEDLAAIMPSSGMLNVETNLRVINGGQPHTQ